MYKGIIKSNKVSYKIGFSASLSADSISAYSELAKWEFESAEPQKRIMITHFCKGYSDGLEKLRQVKSENDVNHREIPTVLETTDMYVFSELDSKGYAIKFTGIE